MEAIFLRIVNMSLIAGWLVLAVLLLRLALKNAPKALRCALWSLVAIRLVLPFSFESMWSILPSAEPIPLETLQSGSLVVDTGIPVLDQAINPAIGQVFTPAASDAVGNTASAAPAVMNATHIAAVVWIAGMALMLLYTAISYWRLRRRVRVSMPGPDGLWLCDAIETPFILGIFRPRIYIPSAMPEAQINHVAAHERAHLRRHDHWWKPLGFLLLSIHWFNPLLWLAYILLCRDIELACDEKVIRDMGTEDKKAYSLALLETSVPRRMIAACPLAFGEVGVKARIRSVLHYKKPAFWLVLSAAVLSAIAAVCLLTDPPYDRQTRLLGGEYKVAEVLYATPNHSQNPAAYPNVWLTADRRLYLRTEGRTESEDSHWSDRLTPSRFLNGMFNEKWWTGKRGLPEISDAWLFQTEDNHFYMFMQTKKGKTLLAYGWEDMGERHEGASDDSNVFYLCRLENQFGEHHFDVNFFARSLRDTVGSSVEPFAYWSHADKPGYAVVGFHAGEGNGQYDMPDMGYAVFETENGGYLLKDWHVYPGSAKTPSRMVMAAPAVLGDVPTDSNTYDVILSSNPYLHTVKRVYYKGDTVLGEAKYLADISYSMLMLPWDAYPEADHVSQYFYDEEGRLIDPDTGAITEADGTVAYQPSYTYQCGSWLVSIPGDEYAHLLWTVNVNTEVSPGHRTLTSIYERTSVEEARRDFGDSDGMGFLFGITMLEGQAYQGWLDEDFPGYTLFARDNAGRYFFKVEATDVRYYRSDPSTADYSEWERLMALAEPACQQFININALIPYTRQEALKDRTAPVLPLVGQSVSPDQRYEIRLNGVNTDVTSGGLHPPESVTIHDRQSGNLLWKGDAHYRHAALWSSKSDYLALALTSRNRCFIAMVNTRDWITQYMELRMPDGSNLEEYIFPREIAGTDGTGMQWVSDHELEVFLTSSVTQTNYTVIVDAAAPRLFTLTPVKP